MNNVNFMELAYPCAKYCLARIGVTFDIIKFLDIQSSIKFIRWEDLEVGDIVVWKAPEDRYEEVVLQVFGTTTVTTKVKKTFHYGVYEGNGLVSDMVMDYYTHIPRIRMQKCEDCFPPCYIITKTLLQTLIWRT